MPDGKSGRTPLHHAVERDDLTTVGYLILEVCVKDYMIEFISVGMNLHASLVSYPHTVIEQTKFRGIYSNHPACPHTL